MATLSINVPDAVVVRVLDAIAARYGYIDENTGQPRTPGQTKTQFAREVIRTIVKDAVKAHEAEIAQAAARQTAISNVESEIVLT